MDLVVSWTGTHQNHPAGLLFLKGTTAGLRRYCLKEIRNEYNDTSSKLYIYIYYYDDTYIYIYMDTL